MAYPFSYLFKKSLVAISSLEYFLGTVKSKMLLGYLGTSTQIHWSVKYWDPYSISIGDNCEIRHGSFIDARSKSKNAIVIEDGCRIKDYVGLAAYGGSIKLGKNVLVGRCSTIFGHGGVNIGDNSMLSPYVMIITSEHITRLNGTDFQSQGFTREPIIIGQNVWIGAHVTVLAGSEIAPNVVIAAGAVVKGQVDEGFIYGGIPAKPIKKIPSEAPLDVKVYKKDWGLLE